MGTVISLSAFRKKKLPKLMCYNEDEEFNLFVEGLISQWKYEESKNNINRFISDKLQIEQQDFTNDLNLVANLEQETNLTICVISPTYTEQNLNGWVASFACGENNYSSIELESEAKARLFCVLMYHALMNAASSAAPK